MMVKMRLPEASPYRFSARALLAAGLLFWGVHAHGAVPASEAGTDAGADFGASEDLSSMATIEFSETLLQFPVDLSLFARGNALPAGHYRVDLVMNGEWKGRESVRFEMVPGNDRVAQPCFDLALLELLGVDPVHLAEDIRPALQAGEASCQPLGTLIEGTQAHYDGGDLRLNVSAPQIVLRREARGYVDPALWDHGVAAGLLDYSYNGYRSQSPGSGGRTSHYLGLRAGLNLGAWRLRYHASAGRDDMSGFHYHGNSATLERGIAKWNSRLTLGDTVTDGQVFDSVRFRGLRLDSDERMRPDSQRGFAPIVRGIAQSNAMVSISQLGQEIYQTNVPPGPFVIDDLYPTGIGGDLVVTITESDGSQHAFTIAYAGTAELVRPGTTHYTLAAGQHADAGLSNEPVFVMGNLRRGLSNALTGYAGMLAAEGYAAVSGGLAFNLPIGALATDVTFATTRTQAGDYRGSSARITWSKILPGIGTNVNVASYRYSSQGYYDPAAAFMLRDRIAQGSSGAGPVSLSDVIQPRNRMVVNASQNLPGTWGHVSIAASSQDYWAREGRDTQYQLGWNRQIRRASLGLSASRTHNLFWQRWENQYMLNVSMPLGGQHGMHANSSYIHRPDGQSLNASVSATAGSERQFGFGAFVNVDDRDYADSTHYSGGANASWNAGLAQLAANMSTSRGGSRQYGVSVNGGVVAFGGGVILAPRLGDTIAIVQARHARGARVSGMGGNVRLNRKGYAVVSYLQAYRQNQVSLDPRGLSTDVAIASTTRQVAPTAGAVVLLHYPTERGYSLLVRGRLDDGRHLPFAAAVFDGQERSVGHIAQGGQGLIRVNDSEGTLQVRWGQGRDQSCQFDYALDDDSATDTPHDFRQVEAVCVGDGLADSGH